MGGLTVSHVEGIRAWLGQWYVSGVCGSHCSYEYSHLSMVCMYVHLYPYTLTCLWYACMYTYTLIHRPVYGMHVRMYTYTLIHRPVYGMHVCTPIPLYTDLSMVCMYVHLYPYTQTCLWYACMYTYTLIHRPAKVGLTQVNVFTWFHRSVVTCATAVVLDSFL